MNTEKENPTIPFITEEQKKQEEIWRKSIPAQVFLNYFFAISFHIQKLDDASGGLQHVAFFREYKAELTDKDLEAISRLLHSAWSTEYALRATGELGNADYLRNALHWTFPQAYYAIFAALQAFLYTLDIKSNNPTLIRREAGRLVHHKV